MTPLVLFTCIFTHFRHKFNVQSMAAFIVSINYLCTNALRGKITKFNGKTVECKYNILIVTSVTRYQVVFKLR